MKRYIHSEDWSYTSSNEVNALNKNGTILNADVNGAANILRKCKQNVDFDKLCKGLLASPKRIRLS